MEKELAVHDVRVWYGLPYPVEDYLLEESLFLADSESVCRGLLEKGCCVIAWLHEKNREESLEFVPYGLENPEEAEYEYYYRVYCRYHNIPWIIGETSRCRIREMRLEDLEDLYEIYKEPSITAFMEDLYQDKEEERRYIQAYIKNVYGFFGFGTWIIEKKSDKKVIGRAGFNYREGYAEPELGFVIGVPYQRQGYAYECCSRILEIGKEYYRFDTVQVLLKAGNEASLRLCEKLGFEGNEQVWEQGELYRRMLRKD